jgi:Saccharopine dehydrogenase C-terminal domain
MLQHKFEIENKDGRKETRTSTLCEYGAPTGTGGYSAMAKLVGVTCGVGKSPRCLKFLSGTAMILKRQRCIAT